MEESRIQPDEPSPSQEERVVSEPVEPARNGERLNRDLSEEPQVRDSRITHQEPAPQQEKEPREQERRVTKIKGKVPSKFTPWGMAAGQESPRKGMKKSERAKGSGGRKSGERSLGPNYESEGMDTSTSEPNSGLSYQQTQTG